VGSSHSALLTFKKNNAPPPLGKRAVTKFRGKEKVKLTLYRSRVRAGNGYLVQKRKVPLRKGGRFKEKNTGRMMDGIFAGGGGGSRKQILQQTDSWAEDRQRKGRPLLRQHRSLLKGKGEKSLSSFVEVQKKGLAVARKHRTVAEKSLKSGG